MAVRGQRLAGFIGFLRDLDAVVQQVSGRPMAQEDGVLYVEERTWWSRAAGRDPRDWDGLR